MSRTSPNLDPLTLPLSGSRLIEASAGTGKTFTIALLYLRLVLGHGRVPAAAEQGLLPPQLLVVTFTEAATKELRDRIRSRLTEAAEVFAAPPISSLDEVPASSRLLYQLREDYEPSQWPACQRKLLLAAEWMDEAAVSTIHGWCKRMLSEHAFDSGSLFRLALETDQRELLEQVVRDYWRSFVYPLTGTAATIFTSFWKQPDQLQGDLYSLLSAIEQLDAVEQAPADLLAVADQQLEELKSRWRTLAPALIEQMADAFEQKIFNGKLQARWWPGWLRAIELWAQDPQQLQPALSEAAWKRLTPEGVAEALKAPSDLAEHEAWRLVEEVAGFAGELSRRRAAMLSHAAHWVARRFEQEKQQHAQMGFNDLLERLDVALHGPQGEKLANTIRRQFPVALIDEFQDTDPIQYRIFDRVYRLAENDPDTCLLMIGDPKQAIYAFRGADIYTYLRAREATAERSYTLGINYRSAEPMVRAVNSLFIQADARRPDGAFLFGPGDTSPLPFLPVQAQGSNECWVVEGKSAPALNFWTQEAEEDDKGKLQPVTKSAYHEAMAEACATEIVRLLNLGRQGQAGFRSPSNELRPVRANDFAILVNNRFEADAVRRALARRRVKSVYLSDRDSVLSAPEAREVLAWLRACLEPTELSLLRTALATPSLAQSWEQLQAMLSDEIVLEQMVERFMKYRELWQRRGVLPMLRRFLLDYQVPARLLQRADGERRLTDILHIAELLQQDSQQLDGEHALIHHYIQLLRDGRTEDEYRSLRLESDADLVQVITVHKSKGLEYPLVFLPFATDFRAPKSRPLYVSYHDKNHQPQLVFDPTEDEIEAADRERLGEDIRKLYVALTRARHATWVGAAAIRGWPRSGLGYLINTGAEQPISEHLRSLLGEQDCIAIQALPPASDESYCEEAVEELGPALTASRSAAEHWWISSYSALNYRGRRGEPLDGDIEDPQQQNALEELSDVAPQPAEVLAMNQHGFHKGAGPGTFLHDCLEWCARRGFATVLNDPEGLDEWLNLRCATRGWADWQAILKQWVLTIISRRFDLPGGDGSLSLVELKRYRAELEFWFEACAVDSSRLDALVRRHTLGGASRSAVEGQQLNGMLKGFIDLVFEHEGRYYVLDYKSNFLGADDSAYHPEAMRAAILEKRYDLQYVLYLLALHRLLQSRLPDYDYDTHLGGAIYLFLRGCEAEGAGAFVDRPPRELIEALSALFDGEKPGLEGADA